MNQILNFIFTDATSTTITLILTALTMIVTIWVRNFLDLRKYFKRMNLPGPMPQPVLGNFGDVIKLGIQENDINLMNTYGKTLGYFEGTQPVILTTDIKLIKAFLIKDFGSFVNRRVWIYI